MSNSAVILAAGRGTRAWPYAAVRNKCALPVLNEPMVRRLVRNVKAAGFNDVCVVVNYHPHSIRAALAGIDGVRFIEQPTLSGTSDAALCGLEAAMGDSVIVAYGDVVTTPEDLRGVVDAASGESADAAVLVTRNIMRGGVSLNVKVGDNAAYDFVHCERKRSPFVFGGVVASSKAFLQEFLRQNPGYASNVEGAMPIQEADLGHALHAMCADGRAIAAAPARHFAIDVDKPWQLVEANACAAGFFMSNLENDLYLDEGADVSDKAQIAEGVKLRLGKNARIGPYCRIESSVVLSENAVLDNGAIVRGDGGVVYIGENSVINHFCVVGGRGVIGRNCCVGHGAEFIGLMFDRVSVRHPAQLCAVLGSQVNIAAGVITGNWRFDDDIKTQTLGHYREKPERYGEMTFMGDFVRVGNNAVFSPGTRVGAYSCIGPNIWVSEDVPEHSLLILKQEIVRKEWGPDRYGW